MEGQPSRKIKAAYPPFALTSVINVTLPLMLRFFIMKDSRKNYKMVAFISLVKYHRVDSCIPLHNKTAFAKELGMHYSTFKKYLSYCEKMKLGKTLQGHYQLFKLPKILQMLHVGLDKSCRWTDWDSYKDINFTTIYEKVVGCILLKNYRQQQYRIDKKEARLAMLSGSGNLAVKNKFTKKTAREAAKAGMSYQRYVQRMQESMNRDIVSGKNHVANLLGYSATSGSRWLQKLVNSGDIRREVVYRYTGLPLNPGTLEVLEKERRDKKGLYGIIPTPSGWLLSIGSKLRLTAK